MIVLAFLLQCAVAFFQFVALFQFVAVLQFVVAFSTIGRNKLKMWLSGSF